MNEKLAKPFLKWAGGKTQLLGQIDLNKPQGNIKCYIEPFVGSGAVALHLAQTMNSLDEIYINDRNPELILVWNVIKYNVEDLIKELEVYHTKFNEELLDNKEERKVYYKTIRELFNNGIQEIDKVDFKDFKKGNKEVITYCINRAAQFIFLNKTCFNGLYRVNKKGEFNVPMGDYKSPKILDDYNLIAVSDVLNDNNKKFNILSPSDYKDVKYVIENLKNNKGYEGKEIFIYFDPPYKPISESSSFTSYSKFNFDDPEQVELANFFKELSSEGIHLMLSNSDPLDENEEEYYFDKLYEDFGEEDEKGKKRVGRVMASRFINSKSTGRGKISEILVTNNLDSNK